MMTKITKPYDRPIHARTGGSGGLTIHCDLRDAARAPPARVLGMQSAASARYKTDRGVRASQSHNSRDDYHFCTYFL